MGLLGAFTSRPDKPFVLVIRDCLSGRVHGLLPWHLRRNGFHGGSPSGTSPYAGHRAKSHPQRPQYRQETPIAPYLSVSSEKAADHAPEPGLVQRYYLYSCTTRLSLSGRNYGLSTRRVLAWRLFNTLDARFCVETLKHVLSSLPIFGPLAALLHK